MGKLERHFIVAKVVSFLSALVSVLLLDIAFQPKVKVFSGVFGVLIIIFLWIMIYVTVSVCVALHDMYSE